MRVARLKFWIISLIVCTMIIVTYKNKESKLSYEEKEPINVYCIEEFQEKIKNDIEKTSIGDTRRVVFVDSKEGAEFILTDEITSLDKGFETIAYTPLVIAISDEEDKIESYEERGYLVEKSQGYTISFDSIIKDVISGNLEEKIYCPELHSRRGELFYDFLLINVNNGSYPKNEQEMEEAIRIVDKFLNSSVVMLGNSIEILEKKKIVENEIYVLLEKDIYSMQSSNYEFDISYPTNTVIYELYLNYGGKDENVLKDMVANGIYWLDDSLEWDIRSSGNYRTKSSSNARDTSYFTESDGFSYVEIPLKQE